MDGTDVGRRAPARAIEKAGGAEALAARLSERIPDQLFLRIVDILQPPKA